MSQRELLVVGAGLTGSLTASLLSRTLASGKRSSAVSLSVQVWEKARGAGGRMSTHRHPAEPSLHVDMGAQYISRFQNKNSDRGDEFETMKGKIYDELLAGRVLVPLSGTVEGERKDLTGSVIENYVAPRGINGVVKHFLNSSAAQVKFRHQLEAVNLSGTSVLMQSPKVLCTATNGMKVECDAVVLTMPIPQILSLGGNLVQSIAPEIKAKLESVRYSSRYALGLFFSYPDSNDSKDGSAEQSGQISEPKWSAKYFDDPVVRFASWGWERRGDEVSAPTSQGRTLLVHTGVPFGIGHLEDDKTAVKELIMKRVNLLIPDLPPVSYSHLIRWRYSQVSQAYPDTPGCVVLLRTPLVVAMGDGFSGSNFENCIWAAMSTIKAVI